MKTKADKKFIAPTQGPAATLGITDDLDTDIDTLFDNDAELDLEITKLKAQVEQGGAVAGAIPVVVTGALDGEPAAGVALYQTAPVVL